MTDLQNHIAAVASRPFDKVAALALVDHFQEAAGYSRWTALRKVAAVRRPGRRTKYRAKAARIMRSKNPARTLLGLEIGAAAGLTRGEPHTVILFDGYKQPTACTVGEGSGSDVYDRLVIAVGARWVIPNYRRCQKRQRAYLFDQKYLRSK